MIQNRWLSQPWTRGLLLTLILFLSVLNLLTFWLARPKELPFEWAASRQGITIVRVSDVSLKDSLPEGALWVAVDDRVIQSPQDVLQWLQAVKNHQRVKLKFIKSGFYVIPWEIRKVPFLPKLWVWLTGILLLGVAAWFNPRFNLSQFHRRLWATAFSMGLIYLFSPIGRWNALDWIFWGLDRFGFALAPPALLHWALSWMHRGYSRTWRMLRLAWPLTWLTVHGTFMLAGMLGFWYVWSESYRFTYHLLHGLDWALLGLTASLTIYLGLSAVPRLYGVEKTRMQIITGSIILAYIPTLLFLLPLIIQNGGQPWTFLAVLFHPLLPIGLTVAITRYRLDIEHLFRVGLIYTTVFLSLGLFYSVLLVLIQWAFQNDPVARLFMMVMVTTIPSILLYPVLLQWTTRVIDRYYFGARSHQREELEHMLWRDLDIFPLEQWISRSIDLLKKALECSWADCMLSTYPDGEPIWVMNQTPPAEELHGILDKSDEPESTFSRVGRPIRPGILRYSTPRMTIYRMECASSEPLRAAYWLQFDSHDHWLAHDDIELLVRLQNRVALALQNSRLFIEVQQRARNMEELQLFHQTILHALDVGLLLTNDTHTKVLMVNQALARWLGTEPDQVSGKPLLHWLPKPFVHTLMSSFTQDPAADVSVRPLLKIRFPTPRGETLLLQVTRRKLDVPMGEERVLGYLYLMEDITHQQQLEQQLIQAEKLSSIGLLAAGIAHEINTPLTGITSYTQMLVKSSRPASHEQRLLMRIQDCADQMREIVQTLLDMGQPQRRTNQVLELQSVIQRALRLLQPHLKQSPAELRIECDELPVRIFGNEAQMNQVLTNLVLNARDAMPTGGTLSVRVKSSNPWAIIEIEDTGAGIDEQSLSRIFDPFYTTKASQGGTGLGLSITYHIVRNLGGAIEVQSEPGRGTLFRVKLPLFTGETQQYGIHSTSAHR